MNQLLLELRTQSENIPFMEYLMKYKNINNNNLLESLNSILNLFVVDIQFIIIMRMLKNYFKMLVTLVFG